MTEGWRIGGRYAVSGRLGAGGMAEVFRARDEVLRRDVAIKVFRSDPSSTDTAARVERRQMELDALARLNHPNLITLYDAELAGHPAYLVMELVEGPSLADKIAGGPLAEPACRELGRQIADALAYVHARGMVHRDVKPANILLGDDGRARLSDFGIVRLLGQESLTNADSTLGTASYLAPEQMHGSQVGPPADVYALGLTLIEALTGTRSFDGPPLEAAMARLARDPVIPAHVAGPWPRLLAAMTARDPHARPSAEQVGIALRTAGDAPAGLPPDAPAGAGVAPLTEVAAASTTVLPPVGGRPSPGVTGEPVLPVAPLPPPRRGVPAGVLVAAVVVLVVLVAGLVALLISSASDDTPSGGGTTQTVTRSAPTTAAGTTAPTTSDSSAPSTDSVSVAPSTPPSSPSSDTTSSSSEPPSTSPDTSSSVSSSVSSSASTSANQAQAPLPPVTTSTSPPAP